jgi:beta-galactosidase
MPNFNRAVTENDLGARMHLLYGMWRKPEFKVRSFDVSKDEEGYLLTVVYEPIGGVAGLKLEYRIHADGALCCTETMSDAGGLSEAPDMFRYGMRFAMPGRFSTLDFFGKGPWENYSDRNSAALLGHYVQSVNDQYHYGYVRTQESGTHTGMRWLKLLDDSGIGLSISSKEFSASALPFSIEDLDCAALGGDAKRKTRNEVYGESQHSPELRAKAHEGDRRNGTTYVCFELVQAGVGGIISWGTKPLEPYLVHPEAREFNFLIRPMAN